MRKKKSTGQANTHWFREYENKSHGAVREMHKAICSDCGEECDVPFKPIEGKPVYCKVCFAKRR